MRAHGKQVDQATAHRVLARADDLADMLVASQCQLGLQLGLIQPLADLELKGVGSEKRRRRQPVEGCGGRYQHHIGLACTAVAVDPPQGGQPFADQVLVRGKGVVGQRFPIGKQGAPQ